MLKMDLIKSSEFSGSGCFQACRSCCKLLALQILMPQQYSADCSRAERGPGGPHSEFNVQYNEAAGSVARSELRQTSGQFLVWRLFWKKATETFDVLRDRLHAGISSQVLLVSTSHWYTYEMLKVRSSKPKTRMTLSSSRCPDAKMLNRRHLRSDPSGLVVLVPLMRR